MVLGDFDRSGRRRPVEMSSGEFVEEADQVIVAIGQALDAGSLGDGVDLKLTRSKFIEINPVNGQTSVPWIFAGGDAATGPSSVAEAVGSGESAAVGMDEMLTGAKHAFWRAERDVETAFDPEADPVQYPRAQMQLIPVARRRAELQRGGAAVRPAGRAARGEAVPAVRLSGQRT